MVPRNMTDDPFLTVTTAEVNCSLLLFYSVINPVLQCGVRQSLEIKNSKLIVASAGEMATGCVGKETTK